jgi:hypothetical protein
MCKKCNHQNSAQVIYNSQSSQKTFNDNGILFPNKNKTPNAKAMSVAIGIPHP